MTGVGAPLHIAAVCEQPIGILSISTPAAYPVIKDFGRQLYKVFNAAESSMVKLTAYTNVNRPRGNLVLPFPSLGPTFGFSTNEGSASTSDTSETHASSDTAEERSDDQTLKCPEKVHHITCDSV